MVEPVIAALRGEFFGQGTHGLVPVEGALVIFLLGLFTGVLLMFALFVWMSWSRWKRQLPLEAEDFMKETGPDAKRDPSAPWERDPEWWRSEDGH